jgi:hypothetical protein
LLRDQITDARGNDNRDANPEQPLQGHRGDSIKAADCRMPAISRLSLADTNG